MLFMQKANYHGYFNGIVWRDAIGKLKQPCDVALIIHIHLF